MELKRIERGNTGNVVIGIDPGFSGAIVVLKNGVPTHCEDMPVIDDGKRKELNGNKVREILLKHYPSHVFLEKAQAMPGQGISGTGRYLTSYGIIRGILIGLGISYTLVSPITWRKKIMVDMPKEKGASIIRAQQLFPNLELTRKKDHGKAEAVLIALYGLKYVLR
jgi:crossover junction endodeoxyribonuclease RuvC